MKTGSGRAGLVVVVAVVVAVGGAACGGSGSGSVDAADDAAPAADASGGVTDAPAPVPDAVPADAALTTTASWTGADGLPEAACVPWLLNDTATPEDPLLAAGLLTLSDDADTEALSYAHPPEVLAMPAMLVIEARVQFVSGATQTPSRTGAGFGFALADDRKNMLFIGDGVVFTLADENVRGVEAAVATTDAAHTYRIEADTVTGAIEFFQDGVSILTSTTFASPYPVDDQVWFGEASQVARGTSIWTSVTHNALVPVACP